ncbi:MAG TPA: hypothetical protein VJ183_09930 [Chloroflexia bacterium]|nr:hypothetical protein [Chloroflexia bacterium]
MASTMGMVGRAVQPDEAVRNVMKRSRFSLHFNTRRVRRWFLVQLVSIPVQAVDEQETASAQQSVQFRASQPTMGRLLDDYMATQFTRRWA